MNPGGAISADNFCHFLVCSPAAAVSEDFLEFVSTCLAASSFHLSCRLEVQFLFSSVNFLINFGLSSGPCPFLLLIERFLDVQFDP